MIQHQPYFQMPYFPQNTVVQNQKPQQGFIVLPSEDEAIKYPVAPGNCVMIKIENQPLIIEKTMGFSQFESPQIKKYRYFEEEIKQEEKEPEKGEIERLTERIDTIEAEMGKIRALVKKPTRKKEEADDE